jgi:outer membrane protein
MKNLAQRVLGFLAVVALTAGAANAQKVAVIDSKVILAAMPEAQAANTRLEAARKIWQDSLQTMETVFQTKADTYQKMGDNVTPDFKKKSQEELQTLQQTAIAYNQAKFGQQGELAQLQAQLVEPIMTKLKNAIDTYGKKEKLTVILDKTATIYVDGASDITSKFQDYLKSTASK